ncbi:MAG: acylphosphatase [Armatimonadota bacterium]
MKKRLRAVIKGTVQGVGYRYFAITRAGSLGLNGWVRNVPNGDVEVVAEGEEPALSRFEEMLRRGPMGAYVRDVIAVRLPATGEFHDFQVRRF